MEEAKTIKEKVNFVEDVPIFAKIKKGGPCQPIPEIAEAEWNAVKNEEDAKKWHYKWTPWFNKDMIDGIVKFGYKFK